MAPWHPAFACAALLVMGAVPLLRRLALATHFVDVPDRRKVHRDPIPYLGGVAIMLAVLTGMLFETRLSRSGAVLLIGAVLLGTMGLVDDDRKLDPNLRLLAEVAAACVALAVGMRIHASGVGSLDLLLTLIWIVGVTNAFNLMDNMDGLAAGIAALAAAALFVLAVFAGQAALATLAAATVGACFGFLAYNRPPASIFMGDAGSLFLGFVLAILTIDVDPNLGVPFSFTVPLMLLALPVLDTTTVTLARLRRQQPVWLGGKDHLSHRLVKRGFSQGGAVAFLLTAQAILATLAVLGGRHVMPLWLAVLASAGVLATVAAMTLRVRVYRQPVKGFPGVVKWVFLMAALALPGLAAPALAAMLRASQPARDAAAIAERALDALAAGANADSRARFEEAAQAFAAVEAKLSGPLTSLGLAVPGVASNLDAARALVDIGGELSQTGIRLADASEQGVPIANGQVDLSDLERLRPVLVDASTVLKRAHARLASIETGFLVPPLASAVHDLRTRLEREASSGDRAARSLLALPSLLGRDGPKRYFLAFQNNTEMRGSGGLIGNWGELTADDGRISLTRFGRLEDLVFAGRRSGPAELPQDFLRRWHYFDVAQTWQNVNVSPDFPTTGEIISAMYPKSGGAPIDGVIAIDPPGLASLLELTGPVTVSGWPEPITSANLVDITLRDAYERYPVQEDRIVFLGELARRVTEAFTSADLGAPSELTRVVSEAARGEHLMVYLQDKSAQALMAELGADGAVPPPGGDSLMVVQQNLAANKVDYYLRRTIRYDLHIDPSRRPARVNGSVNVELANHAPSQGLPNGVIGPYDDRFQAGENRVFLSVYSPLAGPRGTLDGQDLELEPEHDLQRPVRSAVISIPALSTRTLSLPVEGRVRLSPEGWYRLDIPHQPTLAPDHVVVSIRVPKGWRVAEARGGDVAGRTHVVADFQQSRDATISVRIERTGSALLWDKLMGR